MILCQLQSTLTVSQLIFLLSLVCLILAFKAIGSRYR